MDVQLCPDCRGVECPRYQEQVSRLPSLGLGASVAHDVPWTAEERLDWAQAYLQQRLASSDKVAETDVFELHVLADPTVAVVPGDMGPQAYAATEYVALLSNRAGDHAS